MASIRNFASAPTRVRSMMGVVLPVVLVILTVLTGLVITQVRRGTTDERLAANARETVMLDNAVQTTLRWCEWRVIDRPFNTVTVAGTATTPAWRIAANWNDANSLNFTGTGLMPGINGDPTCIVEDATCELQPPISPTGMNASGCNGIDSRWRKFRITARVRINAPDLPNGWREMMAQSELRLYTD
jgi:hypothetical protein